MKVGSRFTKRTLLVLSLLASGCGDEDDDGNASTRSDGSVPSSTQSPSEDGGTSSSNNTSADWQQSFAGGVFHLGPVDWEESQWHNACASEHKYPTRVRSAEGKLLAALWDGIPNLTNSCDTCISVQTARGKSAVLRVVSWGQTTKNSIDVSPDAWTILNSGEDPRSMTWQFTKCPDTGNIMYEFKPGTHEWWSAFWVRNARLPIKSVEVKGAGHDFGGTTLDGDGSRVDAAGGFGKGAFTIRVTSVDGQVITDSFEWPAAGLSQQLLEGKSNFK